MKNTSSPDFTTIKDACKKSAETFISTTQLAIEKTQAIYSNSHDIMQKHITHSLDALKGITSVNSPDQIIAKQQEFLRATTESFSAGSQQMMELTSKATMELFSSLGNKFAENMNCHKNDAK